MAIAKLCNFLKTIKNTVILPLLKFSSGGTMTYLFKLFFGALPAVRWIDANRRILHQPLRPNKDRQQIDRPGAIPRCSDPIYSVLSSLLFCIY